MDLLMCIVIYATHKLHSNYYFLMYNKNIFCDDDLYKLETLNKRKKKNTTSIKRFHLKEI